VNLLHSFESVCLNHAILSPYTLKDECQIYMTARPPLSPPNDRSMRRAAVGTSSGSDRFIRSNKIIQTDQDPCQ
jgi:hypothetical protein